MHQLDSSFRQRKEEAAERRRRALRRRWQAAALGSILALSSGAIYLTRDQWSFNLGKDDEPAALAEPDPRPVFVPAIVDLAGDPMIINIGNAPGDLPKTRDVARPEKLLFPGISSEITVLADTMLSSSERFMTTLPSSQEDFAFFQAQRSRPAPAVSPVLPDAGAEAPLEAPAETPALQAPAEEVLAPETPATLTPAHELEEPAPVAEIADEGPLPGGIPDDVELQPVPLDEMDEALAAAPPDAMPHVEPPADSDVGAGWGETVAAGEEDLPEFKRTRVEDTTSLAFLVPEFERFQQTEDFFVKVKSSRSLDGLVLEQGFGADDAKLAGEALKTTLDMELLDAGYVVALRGFRESAALPGFRLMQVSVYAEQTYLGSVARADDGGFVSGADPWVADDLFNYSGEEESDDEPKQQYRLLDAIYSTAARNNVPTGVIGEAIMLLSRSQDLNAFTTHDDRFLLAFSHEPRDGNAGRVLYVAVRGNQKRIECYVFRPEAGGDFTCMTEDNQSVTVTVSNGMVTPVNGVKKSTFGPRKHPILGVVRIHKGVDWAAPIGSPVFAAFDGEISYAGDGEDYGNFIKVKHDAGRETRYAHLSRFAQNAKPGTAVKAGEIIGYVGTTGLSTGPHLHFELYVAGQGDRSAAGCRGGDRLGRVGGRQAGGPHHPRGERRQRDSRESALQRNGARTVHLEHVAQNDAHLSAGSGALAFGAGSAGAALRSDALA